MPSLRGYPHPEFSELRAVCTRDNGARLTGADLVGSPYQSPEPLGQPVVADSQWAPTRAPDGKHGYPVTTPIHDLGHLPEVIDCPYCGLRGRTVTSLSSGNMNHAWACCLFFHSVIFTFIPYMVSGLKDVEHRCQGCEKLVAVWHRTGHTQVK